MCLRLFQFLWLFNQYILYAAVTDVGVWVGVNGQVGDRPIKEVCVADHAGSGPDTLLRLKVLPTDGIFSARAVLPKLA